MFGFRVFPAHSVIRLHVEIPVTDTEAMATRELHQVLSNFVHFSSSEMIWVVLSLGYFPCWCWGHHRTCLWSQARRSVCVSTDEADWPNEGVKTRRFLLSVLGGTIYVRVSCFRQKNPATPCSLFSSDDFPCQKKVNSFLPTEPIPGSRVSWIATLWCPRAACSAL